jgi:hypothetical protein
MYVSTGSTAAARTQANAHRNIEIAYAAHRRDQRANKRPFNVGLKRISELEGLFACQYGRTLPDDDAGRDDLLLLLHHIAVSRIDVEHRSRRAIKHWATWMSNDEADVMIAKVAACPLRFRAETLGRRIGLTEAVRAARKIKTIWAVDAGETPKERRKRQDRERKARKRVENRAAKPEPASRAKPWEAEGISRRTWYRRKASGGTKSLRNTDAAYTVEQISAIARSGMASLANGAGVSFCVPPDPQRHPPSGRGEHRDRASGGTGGNDETGTAACAGGVVSERGHIMAQTWKGTASRGWR